MKCMKMTLFQLQEHFVQTLTLKESQRRGGKCEGSWFNYKNEKNYARFNKDNCSDFSSVNERDIEKATLK